MGLNGKNINPALAAIIVKAQQSELKSQMERARELEKVLNTTIYEVSDGNITARVTGLSKLVALDFPEGTSPQRVMEAINIGLTDALEERSKATEAIFGRIE